MFWVRRPPRARPRSPSDAELRATLTANLDELRAPARKAEVAFNRADSLIEEIDQILRTRQADALIERTTSPLSPIVWAKTWQDVRRADEVFLREVRRNFEGEAQRALNFQRLPIAVGLLISGVILIIAGQRFGRWLTRRIERSKSTSAANLASFVVSLMQILVPAIGLMAVFVAGSATLASGSISQALLGSLLTAGFVLLAGRWLATKLFPKSDALAVLIPLEGRERRNARRFTTVLALLLGANILLNGVADAADFDDATIGVLRAPLIVFASLAFWRLGAMLRLKATSSLAEARDDDAIEAGFLPGVLWVIGRALFVISLAAPTAAAFGYANLAAFMVFPTISSLALVAVIAILHLVIRDIYALVTGRTAEETGEALVPVLLTFAMGLAAIPEFALIWGARWNDIVETWNWLQQGITVGDARIGLDAVLTIAVVFAIGYAMTRLLQATLRSAVLPRTKLDTGGRNAITAGVGYVGMTVAAIAAITVAGIDLTGFALVASALSIGIGFGLQTIVSNFVSGLILLIERPISEGDWIEVAGGQMGIVKDISVRSTTIETFDRTDVIIPNGDLVAGVVTNWTRGNTVGRVIVSVGVAYSSDSKQVEAILREACEAHPLVTMNPPPRVFFRRFGADALEFDCFCILRDVNFKLAVHSDLNHTIHARFREEGIEIPFAQRDVWLRNPETLQGPRPPAQKKPPATTEGKTA